MLQTSLSKEKVIAVFSVAGFVLAFVAKVYANSGVNFNPGFFIPLFKNLSETIFPALVRTSSDQIASKKI